MKSGSYLRLWSAERRLTSGQGAREIGSNSSPESPTRAGKEEILLINGKIWKTRDGKRIPLSKLGDQHLLNAHRRTKELYLQTLEDISFCFSPFAPSEDTIAYDDMQKVLDDDYDRLYRLHRIGKILRAEIDRRHLYPKSIRIKHRLLPQVTSIIDGRDLGASGGCIMKLEHQPEEEYDHKIPF